MSVNKEVFAGMNDEEILYQITTFQTQILLMLTSPTSVAPQLFLSAVPFM
jgi:hypothetical protein